MLNEEDFDFDSFLNDVEDGTAQYTAPKMTTKLNGQEVNAEATQQANPATIQSTIETTNPEESKAEAGSIEFEANGKIDSPIVESETMPEAEPESEAEARQEIGSFLGNPADVDIGVDDQQIARSEAEAESGIEDSIAEAYADDIDFDEFLSSIDETNGMTDLNNVLETLPASLAYDVQMKLEDKLEKLRARASRDVLPTMPKDIGEYYNSLTDAEKAKIVDPKYLKKGDAVASQLINAKTAESLDEMSSKYGKDWVIQNLYRQNAKEFGKRTKETAAGLLREIYRARRQKLPWRSKNPYFDLMKDPNFQIAPDSFKMKIQQKADEWKESIRGSNLVKQMLNGDFHLPNTQSYKRINMSNLNPAYLEGEIPENDAKVNRLIGEMKKYAALRDDPTSCLNEEQKDWIQYSTLFHDKDVDFKTWREISKGNWNENSKEWAKSQFESDLSKADSAVWDDLSEDEKRQAFEEYAVAIEDAFVKMADWKPHSAKDTKESLGDWDIDEETADDEAEMAAIANGDTELADSIHKYGRHGAGEGFLPDLYKAIRPIDVDLEESKNEIALRDNTLPAANAEGVEYTIRDADDTFDWHDLIDYSDHKFYILPLLFKDYATPKANFKYDVEDVKTIDGNDNAFELNENKNARGGSTSRNTPNFGSHSAGGNLGSTSNPKRSVSNERSGSNGSRASGFDLSLPNVSAPQIAGHSSAVMGSNGAVASGPTFGKGGSLNTSHAKLAGGFANNQSLLSKLDAKLNTNMNSKMGSSETSNMLASTLEAKILADSNTWKGDSSGDRYSPYTFVKMANNKIEVQMGRKRFLLTSLDNKQLKEISNVFEANQTRGEE